MHKLSEILHYPTLEWHIKHKRTLSENIYRYSSESFITLFTEAREAWNAGKIKLTETDEQLLKETDIGLYGDYEGKTVPLDLPMEYIEGSDLVSEAEYKGKNVALNKPKRGGPKKFYVYVKNKKGNVVKVNFGDSGNLTVKIKEPGARAAFAARHKCATKKDKTKPGYWSCNIGRYWKSLGGSRNFSGYW